MNRYPWYRMYAEARTDAKLRTLTDAQFRVWFNLLCYASEQDSRGTIPPTDPFLLAVEVAGGDEALLEETMARLIALRMIDVGESANTITFSKFTERQYDKPSDTPDATRERKARQREKERDSGVTKQKSRPASRAVTRSHAPEERRGEERKEEENTGETGAGAPPPLNDPIPIQRSKAERETRIPADFPLTDKMREWARRKFPGLDIDYAHEEFCTYWRGDGGRKLDWEQTWQNGMLKAYKRQQDQRPRFVTQADLNSGKARKFVGA